MNSPLLFAALHNLAQAGYFQLLDSMPASHALLDAVAPYRCKLFLPGCSDELVRVAARKMASAQKLQGALCQTLGLHSVKSARLDLLLFWDLPNYLPAPVLSALVASVLPHANHPALIHCYIYTGRAMPAAPGRFRFAGNNQIEVNPQADQTMPAPAYYQEALHKLLAPFVVQRSILLSNGLQEYVLVNK